MVQFIKNKVEQVKAFAHKYQKYEPAAFFIGGFAFDTLSLDRIDSLSTIAQQVFYLLVLLVVLAQMLVESSGQRTLGPKWEFYRTWRVPLLHFFFGNLLNCYTLFFFKASSLASSFIFLSLLCALLVANELPRFRSLGLGFKFALIALCSMSFFAGLIPIFVGSVGTGVFLISLLVGMLPILATMQAAKKLGVSALAATTQVLRPSLAVLVVFLFAYLFRLIPPVPLSIQYMGVYHSIAKSPDGQYQLGHERPWWKIWHNGDQDFLAQPGDKVIVFFRLFSPTHFNDEVRLSWYLDEPGRGWTKQDSIPIKIVGGRDEGFRGYGTKGNFTEGSWRVIAETSDGREIGRIRFSLLSVPAETRELQYDLQ